MESEAYIGRRATTDDLPVLRALWTAQGLPAEALEPYLLEFQVAEERGGAPAAAIGLLVAEDQALLHSEAVSGDDDEARAALWHRIRIIARNQGVRRLWTREDAPYWATCGFAPTADQPPPALAGAGPEGWISFDLETPRQAGDLMAEQLNLLKLSSLEDAQRLQDQIRWIRGAAYLVGGVVIAGIGALTYVLLSHPAVMQRLTHGR